MIGYYILVGTVWSCWLEYFTTKHLEGEYGASWKWLERAFHITFFPISIGTFIVAIFRNK